jgi:DNA-binding XRE family transcriptional regulator
MKKTTKAIWVVCYACPLGPSATTSASHAEKEGSIPSGGNVSKGKDNPVFKKIQQQNRKKVENNSTVGKIMVMYNNVQLRELRKSLGLTMEQFGGKLGVKRSTVCCWEKGKSHPRFTVLEKINLLATSLNGNRRETNKVAV